ncbi:MAG: hypothetical protein VB118_00040 [Oscillospiraceae bacterium]|nr:hypothetical protein [Oscillospiraceae bacterium]
MGRNNTMFGNKNINPEEINNKDMRLLTNKYLELSIESEGKFPKIDSYVDQAEAELNESLNKIEDKELRSELDIHIGAAITRHEIRGFVIGSDNPMPSLVDQVENAFPLSVSETESLNDNCSNCSEKDNII